MSEQERDNGQDVRNAGLTTLSDGDLLDSYAAGWVNMTPQCHDAIRNEILRRMSTGNAQNENEKIRAVFGRAMQEAEQRDGRIEAGKGAIPSDVDYANYGRYIRQGAGRYFDSKTESLALNGKPERSDGRVSDQSGDNGRKGENAVQLARDHSARVRQRVCEKCGEVHHELSHCQEALNGGVTQDEAKDKS